MSSAAHPSPADQPAVDIEAVVQALSAPFDPGEVKFKPGVVSGHRALALAYVDVRVVQDRLDEVLGVLGWQDSYKVLPDGTVMCRLRIRLGDQWITKVDVGGQSEQPDVGDRTKAAFSDALKRAAVKFGVGRYLYRLPAQWADFDPAKRQFLRLPALPAHALPRRAAGAEGARSRGGKTLPANGADLERRLAEYDKRLAGQGLCQPGELIRHVVQAGEQAGHGSDLKGWSGPAIQLAADQTKVFEARCREQATPKKDVA